MINELYKKLNSITLLPPVKENELIIRNMCHRLINELNLRPFPGDYCNHKEKIRNSCLDRIRLLNYDLILKSNKDNYAFESYDITSAVKNTVCACEIVLCKNPVTISFKSLGNVTGILPIKLLISIVTLIIRIFYISSDKKEIFFSVKRKKDLIILLARSDNNKPDILISSEEISVLRKAAYLLGGSCLIKNNNGEVHLAFSIKSENTDLSSCKMIPDYVDLLLDKISEIHIGLSGIN